MNGKVVAITGASAGIGRACARELARRGADVADAEQVERAAALIESELGPIDVWVNAAMATVLAEVADTSAPEVRRVTEVTYLGSVHGIQVALRRMLPRDRGVIVQLGSALSRRGIPLQASYCGAKHAVKG